jgi:HEAT repeat protein
MTLALTILRDPQSAATLHELLADASEEVRGLALRGLGQLADRAVVEIAPKLYATGGPFMRQEALDVLGALGTPEADAALRRLRVAEPRWRYRRAIDRALRKSGGRSEQDTG